ncbi:unnamed protein product [Brassicogethes aeneus]|uniref:Uncharacterized protein n=1 Tax=Brassicogethes aeneus TaxID=1431903 RepID=A0A9P0ANA5_BRAAE|nr:unnamed protein product [Brassicogethes aeneus]
MEVMDKLVIPEPQWILDRSGSGPAFWRRDNGNNQRVKFRHDVEVKEFCRGDHELEETYIRNIDEFQGANMFTMGVTCIFCVAVTVLLPWYLLLGTN